MRIRMNTKDNMNTEDSMQVEVEIDYNCKEFEVYREYYLNKISYEVLESEPHRRLAELAIHTFYEEFKIAQRVHKNFFWHLLDPDNPADYKHLQSQARAWGFPIFSFEKEDREKFYHRMVKEGLDFIQWMGTAKQTEDILSTIFGKKDDRWWYSDYQEDGKEFISIEVYMLEEEQKLQALEYLERAIPPYIQIEIIRFVLKPHKLKNGAKKYSYDELVAAGGSPFIKDELKDYVKDAIMLPHEAFTLNSVVSKNSSSKFTTSTKRELMKITKDSGDQKVIILFTDPAIKLPIIQDVIDNYFLRGDDSQIYVFRDPQDIYKH
ncbi:MULTISPECIES: hypothetical protein [unclassified Borrelia]|uniref:hypothetical protein n=1 Tax=unclassified Borrelia TaxID=2649934 RepID=UPI001E61FF2C|nr:MULTISPECIES: hypothetical protein [unclassified Borrelia]UGQ16691.1 hypothetical protein LSO06_05070 [Borrelia sp. RT5S]UGQ17849.1 hypothetical protein LSO05_05305 [Borrelia sp. RT1S]